jgi:transposase-like protein
MARGQKYSDEIKERAFALLAVNNNIQEVARQLKVPYTTLKGWEKEFLKQSLPEEVKEQAEEPTKEPKTKNNKTKKQITNFTNNTNRNLVELRNEKKKEFITQAWGIVDKATKILEQRLDRALYSEQELDELVKQMRASNELSSEQVKELYRKMALIKIEDAGKLATIIGTMYDKQALANNEPTSKIDGSLKIEDMIKKVTGESDF